MSAATLLSRLDADDAPLPATRIRSQRNGRRRALAFLGGAVTSFGLLLMPLPGPIGLPVTLAGLILLLRHSHGARRRFVRASRRWPRVFRPVRRWLKPRRPASVEGAPAAPAPAFAH
jgi:hypothetical protein